MDFTFTNLYTNTQYSTTVIVIEHMIRDSFLFKVIVRKLDRDCTSISKEIRHHIILKRQDFMVNHLTTMYIVMTVIIPIFVIAQAVETAIVAFVQDDLMFVLIIKNIYVF